MTTAQVAIFASIVGVVFAAVVSVQTFWISRAIDTLTGELRQFKGQTHADLQVHTETIAELRDRVTRLEGKDA